MRRPNVFIRTAFQLSRLTLRPLCRGVWGLEVSGREHIPADGPLIVCANHASLLDAFVVIAAVDVPIRFVITWDFYGPLAWRWIFWACATIPIGGGASLRRTVDRVNGVLEDDGIVGVFPEGRISLNGALQPFQHGVARLALRAGAPILPVYIDGSFEAMPRWARWPRRKPIRVRVGPVLPVPAEGPASASEARALTVRLEEAIRSLV